LAYLLEVVEGVVFVEVVEVEVVEVEVVEVVEVEGVVGLVCALLYQEL
jgi:hypothetical protein